MIKNILYVSLGMALISLLVYCKQNDKPWHLDSPDGNLRLEVAIQKLMTSERLFYSVYTKQNGSFNQLLDLSPLGIEREDTRFIDNLEFLSLDQDQDVKDSYSLVSGKILDRQYVYNEISLTFKNQDKQKVTLDFRAFNDGIAFRYRFNGKSQRDVRVIREFTGFDFKEGNCWAHPYDTLSKWTPAYETYYDGPMEIGTPAPWNKNGWAFPLLVESKGSWMLVSEAGFDGSYGASHLHSDCENGLYMVKFAEQGEAEGYFDNTSNASLPWSTPWRFIAIADSPAGIVETMLPTDLAEPSRLKDVSWIQPGRASWSWWSESDSPQDYDRLVPFVDLAAEMGWEYSLVDANWNRMKNGTLEDLASYAESKGIGLLAWYNSGGKHNVVEEEPRDQMDDRKSRRLEFERIARMGIRGIKVDFFQSDKQEIMKQYLEILEDAAEFKLLVNFHGCTMPRGWRRTWPNLLTMEAVRGEECYKFDSRYPEKAPGDMTILPFTRNAVGPVDYTPGGFSDHTHPHLTTYGFELAVPVLLESGIMHHSDTPGRTLGLPGFAVEFLREIPVVWEETRYLDGYPGTFVVVARRSGDRWYIAGVNGENEARDIIVDLSRTGKTPENIHWIGDGKSPRDLQSRTVGTDGGKLVVHLPPYGGFTGYWE